MQKSISIKAPSLWQHKIDWPYPQVILPKEQENWSQGLTSLNLYFFSKRKVNKKQVQCSNGPPLLRLTSQTSQK